jgi:hypothetical protein
MAFSRGSSRTPAPAPPRGAVFAVGARAFVSSDHGSMSRVMLTDDDGKKPFDSLGDGDEVAILAWRPGWAGNTRYCVRNADGLEGWLPGANLRTTEVAVGPPPSRSEEPPTPLSSSRSLADDVGHRFGQRSR